MWPTAIKLLLLLVIAAAAWLLPRWLAKAERSLQRVLSRISRHGALSLLLLAISALIVPAAVTHFTGAPVPTVHDEFSYLLAADTFASGRLSNPSPPLPEHFESFHVLVEPTYASKYPPAQGLLLALGEVAFGDVLWGVRLSAAFAAIAVWWMLRNFLPPRFAFFGALVFLFKIGFASYWTHSFWGGNVAACGGALVLGSARALRERWTVWHGMLYALGLLILAMSRPYEGLVCAALSLVVYFQRGGHRFASRPTVAGIVAPGVVIALGAAFLLRYDVAVTGSPFELPHAHYAKTREAVPAFFLQSRSERPVSTRSEVQRHLERDIERYDALRTLPGFTEEAAIRVDGIRKFFFGFEWAPALLVLPLLLRSRSRRPVIVLLVLAILASLLTTWWSAHYFAPFTAIAILCLVLGIRRLRVLRSRKGPFGRALVFGCCLVALPACWLETRTLAEPDNSQGAQWARDRARIERDLLASPGKDLVLVDYPEGHDEDHEWVYDGADLDSSEIVWARSLGDPSDRLLRDRFEGRSVWRLVGDTKDAPAMLSRLPSR